MAKVIPETTLEDLLKVLPRYGFCPEDDSEIDQQSLDALRYASSQDGDVIVHVGLMVELQEYFQMGGEDIEEYLEDNPLTKDQKRQLDSITCTGDIYACQNYLYNIRRHIINVH